MEIFKVFGLDWKILLAQLINFAILVAVLYKFGYKPIFKILDDRKKKIDEGLENAALAEKKINSVLEEEKNIIKNAKIEAAAILEKTKEDVEESRKRELIKTREEIGKIINQEKENMRQEKAEVLRDIKKEVSDLVVSALEKVLEEKVDGKKNEEIIKKAVEKIK
jgi:F-type H+-transporting ATPase subunit b